MLDGCQSIKLEPGGTPKKGFIYKPLTAAQPAAAVSSEELIRLRGTLAPALVDAEAGGSRLFPFLEDGIDEFPGDLDGVAPREQGSVAL